MEIRDPQHGPLSSHGSEGFWRILHIVLGPPKSKHLIGGLAIIALILNRQGPKLIIGDLVNKGGPTLQQGYDL